LTEAESRALIAPFGDEAVRGGAKGDANILYISHIHVSDRLNSVLGIGQWCLVKRSQRAEQTKTVEGKPLTRVYYEGVMLIRGTFVTEAIGVGQYHPNNPKEDYGSALESAMSDCITRCCKRLGIGSQVWDKGYCDRWLATKGGTRKPVAMPTAKTPDPNPAATPAERSIIEGNVESVAAKTVKGETRYGITLAGNPAVYGTFDEAVGRAAKAIKEASVACRLTWEKRGDYFDALAVEAVTE
jgi:hypothetical protein